MGLQVAKKQFGIAKQSGKGTIAANPYFAHGLASGGLTVAPNQESDPLTSAYVNPAGAYRDKVENGASYETRAWQKALGLYLLGVLGSDVVTGANPYTHTITLGSALPYLTAFEKASDNTLLAVKDCKVDSLELAWEENKPLVCSVKLVGGAFSVPSTFTPTVDECDTSNYYTPVGGTFKLDTASATPVVTPVTAGKITIARSAEAKFFSGVIEAGDVGEGACDVDVSLTVVPDDMTVWRKALTGAINGTSIATAAQYGSFEVTFVKGADSLKLSGGSVTFLTDLPEADPSGGFADAELVGKAYRGATATPITAVLVNTQATY